MPTRLVLCRPDGLPRWGARRRHKSHLGLHSSGSVTHDSAWGQRVSLGKEGAQEDCNSCILQPGQGVSWDMITIPVLCRGSQCWRNGRERETEWCGHSRERQNWRLKGGEEQPDVSSWGCYLGPQWSPGLWCHQGPGWAQGSAAGFVTTKSQVDVFSLGCSLGTCWLLRDVHNWPQPSTGHCGRASPGGMKAGELTLPFTISSILKSGPRSSSGQHSRAAPASGGTGKLAQRAWCWKPSPATHLLGGDMGEREMAPSFPLLSTEGRRPGSEVIRVRRQALPSSTTESRALPLIYCSTRGSRSGISHR
jgi:hypothetical protein